MAAQVIADDAEALAVAAELATRFRAGASERDAERRLPREEVDQLSASGLLAVTVPAGHGGADVRQETLAEVFRLLATADGSLAQIPRSHFAYVNVIRRQGTEQQQKFVFSLNLHRHWRDARTHTLHDPPRWKIQHIGRYVLNGTRPPRHGLL